MPATLGVDPLPGGVVQPNEVAEDRDFEAAPYLPASPGGGSKTARWVLSEDVRARMESVYRKQKFPSMALRENLAKELDVTLRQVQVWFQNRRQRDERQLRDNSRWNQWNAQMHFPPMMGQAMAMYPGMHMAALGYPGYPPVAGYPPVGYPSPVSMAAAAAYQQHPHIAAALAAQQSAAAAAHAAMYAAAPAAVPPTMADSSSSNPLAVAPSPSYMAALAAAAAQAAMSPYVQQPAEGLATSGTYNEAHSYVQQQGANASAAAAAAAMTLAAARGTGTAGTPPAPAGSSEPHTADESSDDREFSRQPTLRAGEADACGRADGMHEASHRAHDPHHEPAATTALTNVVDTESAGLPPALAACGWSTRGYPPATLQAPRASPSSEEEHLAPDALHIKRRRVEEPSPYPPNYSEY